MEVLQAIGVLVAVIAAIALLVVILIKVGTVLAIALGIALLLLPLIAGIVGCVLLWQMGYDNEGVLLLVVLFVAEFPWFNWVCNWKWPKSTSSSWEGHDWRDSKVKIYDEKGHVIGYRDRD